MMDYTVGSLADMISGSSTNKKKKRSLGEQEGMRIEYQELPSTQKMKQSGTGKQGMKNGNQGAAPTKNKKRSQGEKERMKLGNQELPLTKNKERSQGDKERMKTEQRELPSTKNKKRSQGDKERMIIEHLELPSTNKKTKSKGDKKGVQIEQEPPSIFVNKNNKKSKKRKTTDDESNPKKKRKVHITLPTPNTDDGTSDFGLQENEADNALEDGAELGAFNIATLETQDKSNAKHARKRLKKKGALGDEPAKNVRRELDPEEETRTIFVGNLSNQMTKFNLANIFRKFGKVESVRLRCAAVADPKTSKKVAVMRREFHPERTNINSYIRFESAESAKKALAFNGTVVRDHTIRVDLAGGGAQRNPKNAVFVGNIPFSVEEEELHRLFDPCGKIESIRLIRDSATSMGKGFAYVNFEDSQSVELALKLDGEELGKRPLRVSRCHKKVKGSVIVNNKKNRAGKGEVKKVKKKKNKPEPGAEFQGQEVVNGKVKTAKKKKKKKNKGELQKKKILGMLHMTPKEQEKKVKVKKSKKDQQQ